MKKIPICEIEAIHQDTVEMVKEKLPQEEILYDLGITLGMTQSAISHQLRVLKQGRLVKYRKEGKVVYYSLDDEHVIHIIEQGLTHIGEKR